MNTRFIKNVVKRILLPKIAELKINKTDFALKLEFTPKYYFLKGGNLNSEKIFYIIQRSPGAGFFSNIAFIINHLKIAEQLNAIPILDSFNFPNLYNEAYPRINSWNSYLNPKNNICLEDVYKSKNILITTNEWTCDFQMSISKMDNAFNLFFKYFNINDCILLKVDDFIKKNNFISEKIIGLHFRGGDQKTANGHQFPLTKSQIKSKLNELLKKNDFTKIFCSTESLENYQFIKKVFKDKVIFYDSYRSKNNSYLENPREKHRQLLGEEILIEALILSKTDFFVCGNSNVSEFVKILRSNANKPTIELRNGKNSNNPIIALFLYKFKNILPSWFGGFKRKL